MPESADGSAHAAATYAPQSATHPEVHASSRHGSPVSHSALPHDATAAAVAPLTVALASPMSSCESADRSAAVTPAPPLTLNSTYVALSDDAVSSRCLRDAGVGATHVREETVTLPAAEELRPSAVAMAAVSVLAAAATAGSDVSTASDDDDCPAAPHTMAPTPACASRIRAVSPHAFTPPHTPQSSTPALASRQHKPPVDTELQQLPRRSVTPVQLLLLLLPVAIVVSLAQGCALQTRLVVGLVSPAPVQVASATAPTPGCTQVTFRAAVGSQ